MQPTKREAVSYLGLPFRLGIGNDVGRVEQFLVTEAAERTLMPVRFEYPLPECLLVQSSA